MIIKELRNRLGGEGGREEKKRKEKIDITGH